jgi:hypothetical protein
LFQEQKGWWFSREDDFFRASFVSDCDKGFNESLGLILETWKTFGPFDGILGFSQGAAMAGLLCSMQVKMCCYTKAVKKSFSNCRPLARLPVT